MTLPSIYWKNSYKSLFEICTPAQLGYSKCNTGISSYINDIIEGIKLQYTEQKIIMNEDNLKKLGYNNIALEMLLKREAQINADEIFMPGERPRLNIDSTLQDIEPDDVVSKIEEIENLLNTLKEKVNNLPEYTIKEEQYDEDVREFPTHKNYILEYLKMALDEIPMLKRNA